MFKLKWSVLPQLQSALVTLALTAAAQADGPRIVLDYVLEYGGGMSMNVPDRPLTEADLERWAALLNASDAQLNFMRAEYMRYVEQNNAYLDGEAPRYLAQCRRLSEIYRAEGLSTPAYAKQAKGVNQVSRDVRQRLIAIEHAFIDRFEPILTEEQRHRLMVIRHDVSRRNCRIVESFARWADTELRHIWDHAAAAMASPDELMRVRVILDDYEARLTMLICARADYLLEMREALAENRIARRSGLPADEANARMRRMTSGWGEIAQHVRTLHEQTCKRILESVSPEIGEAFTDAVKRDVFPELYPDPYALHHLLDLVSADEMLDGDARAAAAALTFAYEHAYARISKELEDFCVEWSDQSNLGVNGYQRQFFGRELQPRIDARKALSRDWLERLELAVGAEALARHAELIPAGLKDDEPAP